jgi:TipAS antibiotic-recognition domain
MDIEIPPWLYWVAYLAGSQWPGPPASETGCWQDADSLWAAADGLKALIDPLQRVRSHTQAVLSGETAQAVDVQFAQLFEGPYSVDALVDALNAVGNLAENIGTEIQYTKLQILTTLGIAAATIIWALATSSVSLGGSLAEIPIAELLAENTIRDVVSMLIERIGAALAETLTKTLVARLLIDGAVSAGIGVAQQLVIQGVLAAEGHAESLGTEVGQLVGTAWSMGVMGAAGGLARAGVGAVVGEVLGSEGTAGIVKNVVTGLSSGVAANVAGQLIHGNDISLRTFLAAAPALFDMGEPGSGSASSVHDPADSAVPANAIDTHPTLRFERQPDGTFAWPGEHADTIQDPSASTNEGAPQALAAAPRTPAADPAGAAGDRANGAPPATTASESATGPPGARDSATTSSNGSTAEATPAHGDLTGPNPRSVNPTPATPDTAAPPPAHLTADVDAAPATNASLGSGIREGALDLSSPAPAVSVGPVADAGSPAVSDLAGQSAAVGVPAAAPEMPRAAAPDPSSTPPATPSGPSAGSPNPTPDARAGLAESHSAARESAPQPTRVPAAGRFDTTATPDAGTHDTVAEHAASAQAVGVDPAAPAGRSGADAHLLGRSEGTRADTGRATDPLTTRRDPARPDSTRDDSHRPAGARPGKLPRRSGVARDVSDDLQPATTRAPNPLAAAEDIGGIKARHNDSGPRPAEPEPHQGGGDGRNGGGIPEPSTAGGGAGDNRGDGGGPRDGLAGHGDGDDYARARQIYRAQDRTVRRVDTRYADALGEVVDHASGSVRVDQLAEDLSGRYGPYRIEFTGTVDGGKVVLIGDILDGDAPIGVVVRDLMLDDKANLVVQNRFLIIDDPQFRGRGFSKALAAELEHYYLRSQVHRIEVKTSSQGSFAWARRGFIWNPDTAKLQESLDSVKDSIRALLPQVSKNAQQVLRDIVPRLDAGRPDLPAPIELAELTAPGASDLGRQLLDETGLHFVKYLRGGGPDELPVRSRGDLGPGGDAGGAGDVGGSGSSAGGPVDRGAGPDGSGSHSGVPAVGDGGHRGGDAGGTGHRGVEPSDDGGDGESHRVERYFQSHPPSGDAIENMRPGDAHRRVAEVLTQIYGREIYLEPGAKRNAQLYAAAGSDPHLVSYADVEDTLRYLGPDSSANMAPGVFNFVRPGSSIVEPEEFDRSVDVFVAVNIRGEIYAYDPASDVLTGWPPPWSHNPAHTFAGYLNNRGDPLIPRGERADRRFTNGSEVGRAWARLPEADGSQLAQDIGALNDDFAESMREGAAPGSEQANALAERHLAYVRRLFADYSYESHRADGRLLVTDGELRDPLEWTAPGLAHYLRDVIVANAEHHLGRPDDPNAPPPVGPRQPGNPSSGSHPGAGEQAQPPTRERGGSAPDGPSSSEGPAGGDSSNDRDTPDPGTAGGGAGDDRGGDGGAGDGGAGHDDGGDDVARRQRQYRAQDPTTRPVDTRYAERVDEWFNDPDLDLRARDSRARQLAEDLSGVYGRYRLAMDGGDTPHGVTFGGSIFSGDEKIGGNAWTIRRTSGTSANATRVISIGCRCCM